MTSCVTLCNEPPARGRKDDVLLGLRPVTHPAEHLRAIRQQLHGTAGNLRRHHRERHVRPRLPLAAERPADERRDHGNALDRDLKRGGDRMLHAEHPLRRIVDRHPAAVPGGDRAVGLHRIVVFRRRTIGLVDAYRAARDAGGAAPMRCGLSEQLLGAKRLRGVHIHHRRIGGIGNLHEGRGVLRLFEGLGDDDRDRLAIEFNRRRSAERRAWNRSGSSSRR